MKLILNILRLLRPRQWIKNFAVFAAILFSGQLFEPQSIRVVIAVFIIFCGLSSSIYIINDIFDIKNDRMHPFKKFRPLANKEVPIPMAVILALLLGGSAIYFSYNINPAFLFIAIFYFVLHIAYSAILKHIEIIDILTLAAGYILRVLAGEVASSFHISVWLLLSTISLSLFLAIGKRRSELSLLSQHGALKGMIATRKTLSHYTEQLLDVYLSIFATSTFISYSLFTFLENPRILTSDFFSPDLFGNYLQRKWLMITIIPVVYGLMRYLQKIYEKHEGESPERVLFSDRPLLISVLIWAFLAVFVIYFI